MSERAPYGRREDDFDADALERELAELEEWRPRRSREAVPRQVPNFSPRAVAADPHSEITGQRLVWTTPPAANLSSPATIGPLWRHDSRFPVAFTLRFSA
jgi:hypothetical protein